MLGINGLITGILASKIEKKQSKFPVNTNSLQHDVFERTTTETSYENNNDGVPTLKLVKTGGRHEIQTMDVTKIYASERTLRGKKETIYSKNGKRLYELENHNDGRKTKTIYHSNGNSVKSIIEYDKNGKVQKKQVITPEKTRALTQEEEKRIPKYLYHLTSYQILL